MTRRTFLTVKQITLLTGALSAVGAAGIAYGLVSPEKWAAIAGAAVALVTFAGSFFESESHDQNTAAIQTSLNVEADSKPGPVTVTAAEEVADVNQ
jgi:ABC-type Mn2+/Zn2+ transport system permease subunit